MPPRNIKMASGNGGLTLDARFTQMANATVANRQVAVAQRCPPAPRPPGLPPAILWRSQRGTRCVPPLTAAIGRALPLAAAAAG
jgi:hypothetical protein